MMIDRALAGSHQIRSREVAQTLTFETVNLGDGLPVIKRHVDQEAIWKYAVASLDYNPVHCHPDWVKTAQVFGISSTVAHGMMTMSFMASVLTDWAYPVGGWVKSVESKFVRPVLPGDTITCGGVVSEKHPGRGDNNFVVVDLYADNQDGARVAVGKAEVILP